MIELTTGIAFLLSSMYGSGVISNDTVDVQPISTGEGNSASIIQAIDRAELEKYLEKNFSDTPILIEIAKCESELTHFNKDGKVIRGRVDSDDIGVMQINQRYHLETANKLGLDIHTVEGNVAYAKYLYEKSGSEPWKASSPCWSKSQAAKDLLAKK